MSGFFNIRAWVGVLLFACGIMPAVAASPIKTVPWNGYSGAASFTFDDGVYQIETLPQIFLEMPDIKVTFFLSDMGVNLLDLYGAEFSNFAKMGHEIGNHSKTHVHLSNLSEDRLKKEVIDFAGELQQVMNSYGADVGITAHALPFSANSETASKVINERHFINRTSWGSGRHNWDEEPRWTDVDSRAWYTLPGSDTALLNAFDTAAYIGNFESSNPWYTPVKGPSWLVLLNHGVGYSGETQITPELLKDAFKRAKQNNMWIAPFSTVGAYYRAHFTLDTAKAVVNGNVHTVKWTLPHPNMPKSIPMKVTLSKEFIASTFGNNASVVLEQKGRIIYPVNGVYTIEFTDLELNIRAISPASPMLNSPECNGDFPHLEAYMGIENNLQSGAARNFEGMQVTYTLLDAKGKRLGKANGFQDPANMPKGVYIIRADIPGHAPLTKKVIH